MFNPASAFPKQMTFTPAVPGQHHFQRAVNAPTFGPIGAAPGPLGLSTAGRYAAMSRQALDVARGAAGVGAGLNQLYQRPSPANEVSNRLTAKKPGARPNARSNFAAQPQPREQGMPGHPAQDRVGEMAARVLQSPTPVAALPTTPGPAFKVPINRPATSWDSLLDPSTPPVERAQQRTRQSTTRI